MTGMFRMPKMTRIARMTMRTWMTTIMDKSPWDSKSMTLIICVSQVLSQKAVLSC